MATVPFEAKVRHRGEVAIIDMTGDIDALADVAMSAAYSLAASRSPTSVLLNFQGVDYINSTGIALIVGLLGQARSAERRLLVCGLSDHYLEVFQITCLADFMSIFPDEEAAVADAGERVKGA